MFRRLIFPAATAALLVAAICPAAVAGGGKGGPIGACCFFTPGTGGDCEELTQIDCEKDGGIWQGPDTDCSGSLCNDPTGIGACCVTDNAADEPEEPICIEVVEEVCLIEGGTFFGIGLKCEKIDCAYTMTGACCVTNNSLDSSAVCYDNLTESGCEAAGGVYAGDGTGCDDISCGDCTDLPGRPDPDRPGQRVLRGYLIGWAVDGEGNEIAWNHLSGTATLVNYQGQHAWEYNAWAIATGESGVQHGETTGSPGALNFDGIEYVTPYSQLLLNFLASGSGAYSGADVALIADTDLTLHLLDADFTMNSTGPLTTKAKFDVWNENEVKLSGAFHCVTCWDQSLLSNYGVPNHFTLEALQTPFGKARIDGVASPDCEDSTAAALFGVQTRNLHSFGLAGGVAGSSLIGMGTQPAQVLYDETLPPPEGPTPPSVDRTSGTEKGSVVIFSKVELRWDAAGNLTQDTFIALSNDHPDDVRVLFYFVNGDAPMLENGECFHPGWNFVDNEITLTGNEPTWWSVLTGNPKGVSPFTVLDP